jgi:transcriptional antiterminator RfaH
MPYENTGDDVRWFAVHTKPKQEDRADSNLKAWRVETFAPRLRECSHNKYTGARTYITKHLFPRYIFARFDANKLLHKVHFTRGVHSVVSCGNQPTPIDGQVIEVIRSRIGDDGYVSLYEELAPGDEVLINSGPFMNFVGVFDRKIDEDDRVMILLTTVSYQARMVVDREMIRRVNQSRPVPQLKVASGH